MGSEDGYQCPHCKHWHEAVGNHEEDEGSHNCEKCNKVFLVEIEYTPNYYVKATTEGSANV